jgi:hypothetical protein
MYISICNKLGSFVNEYGTHTLFISHNYLIIIYSYLAYLTTRHVTQLQNISLVNDSDIFIKKN